MDDAQVLAVGRLKGFDAVRRAGVIGDVAGGTFFFEHSGAEASAALHPGQLVTFRALDGLPAGQVELLGALTSA